MIRTQIEMVCRTASGCLKDAADLRAQLEQWDRAIALYSDVAKWALSNATTKYSVKEYWLKSGLCLLAKRVRISFSTV
jgi:alpha-soluble NSF attachment protein